MTLLVRFANDDDAEDGVILVDLPDQYAKNPYSGGQGLSEYTKSHLVDRSVPLKNACTLIVFSGVTPVGLFGFKRYELNPPHGAAVFSEKPL